ncbi:MAG: lytic transglycosylase domain-containing protein [Rhodobacterales bacterium]|nr:lytic transglycosylase domain-containing protein [Rhodobacterales bacterium]
MTRSHSMDRTAIRCRPGRLRIGAAVAVFCAALSLAPAGQAQDPAPFPDFTFKRVKPPEPGSTGRRITVQIAPQPVVVARPSAPQAAIPDGTEALGRYSWFWETISPLIDDSGPGRLEPALIHIANAASGQQIAAPRLSDLLNIARLHRTELLLNTVGTRVSPALVLAVIAVESSGRADAVSSAGAVGLMQLIPATADRFGVADSLNAGQNIKGGVAYLDWLLQEFGGDPILALAGYNAGENAVRRHGGVPPYAETRDYVPKVLAAFAVARNLCKTPPMLISDGCVFNLGEG